MDSTPTIWKIEGGTPSLYKTFSTGNSHVYALCAFGSMLFAAGQKNETSFRYKPVWWIIADDLSVTDNRLGSDDGTAQGICVTSR